MLAFIWRGKKRGGDEDEEELKLSLDGDPLTEWH